jgi:serine/threonine-protein kinase
MRRAMLAVGAMSGLALGYLALDRLWLTKHDGAKKPATATVPSANDFNPPAHSIAVLPFVNISGDKDQEYFSDGLTEELLNSLARINELQVAARTSAFSFKGKDADIATIARALNVGAVLEGSVRRSAHTVRITAQLINAITGFHFWSQTYDRDLGDVLKLQTDIANSVASALKVTLLGDMAAKIELGGTRHPAAFDAYLRGRTAARAAFVPGSNGHQTAIAEYTEAIRLDPNYALAFAVRSLVVADAANFFEQDLPARTAGFDRAQADARHAIALAPGLAEGHVALAFILEIKMNYAQASEEYDRAIALGPGNVVALANFGGFAVFMGRTDVGIVAARRAVAADPLNWATYEKLGQALAHARRYEEALVAYQELMALNHEVTQAYSLPGLAHYLLGQFESARAACEIKPDDWQSQMCLAVTYRKLGQRADAERLLSKMKASGGDSNAYQYAEIYAQWGNAAKALEWLDTALRLRDGGLEELKTDPLLDPLRQEPHFRSIERALKFPTVEAQ